ncbi:cry [Symbiodinium sp. CCMP2456]|nr:cry [Symbiodinium sp. CCMP2456]
MAAFMRRLGVASKAGGRSAASLASLVSTQAAAGAARPAILAPQQGISWSFAELEQRAAVAAGALAARGVARGSTVVTDLPNSADNLLLQVACSRLGAAVATAKDEAALNELQKVTDLRLAVTHPGSEASNPALAQYSLKESPHVVEAWGGSSVEVRDAAAAMPREKVSVVWFKATDLRTHDHEPLSLAHAAGLPVLHLYVLDPRWFKSTPLAGFPRTGPRRALFQLEALADLSKRLEAAGHKLCVRRAVSTARAFEELCDDFEVAACYACREVCPEELRLEQKVQEVLKAKRAGELQLCWTYELHHYDDLPAEVRRKGASGFSGYRRCFSERVQVRDPLPRVDLAKSSPVHWTRAEGLPSSVTDLGLAAPAPEPDDRAEVSWVGGETAALTRLEEYFFESNDIALQFVGATNFPHDGHSSTVAKSQSKLSPWLAHGCLSARYLYAELKRYERERRQTDCTARMVHELYFRDFVRFSALLKGSKIFKLEGIYGRHPPGGWLQEDELLAPWCHGRTGFPFLDASMRELEATGSCCHAGREVAAWFLVCDLGIDWRLGAEWFESTLIDYEPASNWFNWAFTCVPRATGGNSIQEEAKPLRPPRTRLQTLEAIYWAAQQDPDGEYIKLWVPELRGLTGDLAREPWKATSQEPEEAPRVGSAPEEWPPALAKERERIGWARRTFPAGGSQVAVWWGCVREGAAASAAPSGTIERRLDPDDGREYTLEGLKEKYRGQYKLEEVRVYWKNTCEPLEAKTDPADGKAYTLAELHVRYRQQYTRQEIAEYFKSSCAPVKEKKGGSASVPRKKPATGWPEGYPLPLLPPASFFSIEEIAEHSRRGQARKAAKAARLEKELGGGSRVAGYAAPRSEPGKEKEPKPKQGPRRWAKAAPRDS